jgi:hypothetical protein
MSASAPKEITTSVNCNGSQGSSVSTVSDYRMDDQAIGVRSLTQAKGFFL